MADAELPERNLFMACRTLRLEALATIAPPFRIRRIRRDELPVWKAMPFDDPVLAATYDEYMEGWIRDVYARRMEDFLARTLVAVDEADEPVGTCGLWDAYDRFPSIHWLKVLPAHEGRGIGRALLSALLRDLDPAAFPVYLHTQPESTRAIVLYTDFGFDLLSGDVFGTRPNHLAESLPFLRAHLAPSAFASLRISPPPPDFAAFLATTRSVEL